MGMSKPELVLSNSLINYKISKENERLFINNNEIVGATSLQIGINMPRVPTSYLGMNSSVYTHPAGQPQGQVTIQSQLVNQDFFFPLINQSGYTGYLLSSTTPSVSRINVVFAPAYLTNYNLTYTDGQIPTVSATFACYDSVGKIDASGMAVLTANATITGSTPNYNIGVPNRGSIILGLNEYSGNRVLGFNITITPNREAIYAAGKTSPYRVRVVNPVQVQANFQLDVGNYVPVNLQSLIAQKVIQTITLSINDFRTNSGIASYTFSGMELNNQGLTATTTNNMVMNLEYKGYMFITYIPTIFSNVPIPAPNVSVANPAQPASTQV